jgi:hypothetical protein
MAFEISVAYFKFFASLSSSLFPLKFFNLVLFPSYFSSSSLPIFISSFFLVFVTPPFSWDETRTKEETSSLPIPTLFETTYGNGNFIFIHFMILEHLVGSTTVGRWYTLRQNPPKVCSQNRPKMPYIGPCCFTSTDEH